MSSRRLAFSRLISFGVGTMATSATSPSRTCMPDGVSIGRALNRRQVGPHRRHAPDDDVELLLPLVDLADLRALEQRRRSPADVAGRQAEALGRLGPQAHLDLRHQHLRLDLQVDRRPGTVAIAASTSLAFARSTSRSGP